MHLFQQLFTISLLCMTLGMQSVAHAQAQPDTRIQAVITGPDDIAVGRTLVLDASLSRTSGENPSYHWYIEGRKQAISETIEAVYTPDKPGNLVFRLVVEATMPDGTEIKHETMHTVTVYNRKIVFIADGSVSSKKVSAQQTAAAVQGLYLRVLHASGAVTPLTGEDQLAAFIAEHASSLNGAETIVLWTDGITGLQSLVRALQDDDDFTSGNGNTTHCSDYRDQHAEPSTYCMGSIFRIATPFNHHYSPRSVYVFGIYSDD